MVRAPPTAHPRIVEAVDAHFECLKPLFDQVSVGVADPTAQSKSSKGSPIAELIDEKRCVREIVFLGQSRQKRSRRIGAVATKYREVENQFCLGVYCSIQPRSLTVDLDSGFVDRDPLRLRLRRVGHAVSDLVHPVPNRSVRTFNAECSENRSCFSERTTGRVEPDGERPDGRCRPLTLPSFF
jgi:hypothetical protein